MNIKELEKLLQGAEYGLPWKWSKLILAEFKTLEATVARLRAEKGKDYQRLRDRIQELERYITEYYIGGDPMPAAQKVELKLEEWIAKFLPALVAHGTVKIEGRVQEGTVSAYWVGTIIRVDFKPWAPVVEEV